MDIEEAALALILLRRRRRRRQQRQIIRSNRRFWIHPFFLDRSQFINIKDLLKHNDKFKMYFKMTVNLFHGLLLVLESDLKRQDTTMRESIPPFERLAITIRYLVTGCGFAEFENTFGRGTSTARRIVKETCQLICNKLETEYIPELNEDRFVNIAAGFEKIANFPNCLGAIDGKHIRITKPPGTGSLYHNYKGYFSLVLLATCDANCLFTFIDAGAYGKSSDSTIYKESKLCKQIDDGTLKIPEPRYISGLPNAINYCFIGDEAFGLSKHMLRPYSGKQLDYAKRMFNYRLSRARRCIECAFGLLSSKFRIFQSPMQVSADFAEIIVKTCCILHNMIRKHEGLHFHAVSNTLANTNSIMGSERSINTRDILKDYFISPEGSVPWQDLMI